jgi:hypothetical protein
MGAAPAYMVLTLLLPPDDHYEDTLRQIMDQGMIDHQLFRNLFIV